jgi:hypothetical protein
MKLFNTHWERVRVVVTPSNLRIGLFAFSIAAIVFGGAAGSTWGS